MIYTHIKTIVYYLFSIIYSLFSIIQKAPAFAGAFLNYTSIIIGKIIGFLPVVWRI